MGIEAEMFFDNICKELAKKPQTKEIMLFKIGARSSFSLDDSSLPGIEFVFHIEPSYLSIKFIEAWLLFCEDMKILRRVQNAIGEVHVKRLLDMGGRR